jgi:transposase
LRPKAGLACAKNNFNYDSTMKKQVQSQSVPTGPIKPAKQMPTVHPHAAGIDLGNTAHFVCVPSDSVPTGQSPVRQFGVFNPELDQMVEWLKQCGVRTVAMESTGVMWIPVFQKLEAAGMEVLLVNTKRLKHVPGRKSDVLDCQWIQQLHSYGMLSGSFRPADIICRLRTLMRQRQNVIASAGSETQHMQKAMQEMGAHLHVVVSDVTGDTGLRIIDAILDGQRDPSQLIKLRDPRVRRSTEEEMAAALQGDWREELLFVLQQSRQAYAFFQNQLAALDEKIIALLAHIPQAPPPQDDGSPAPSPEPGKVAGASVDPSGAPTGSESGPAAGEAKEQNRGLPKTKRKPSKGGNPLAQDVRPQLAQIFGVDLSLIPGLNMVGVLIILSEIGADLKRWRDGDAFAAWLGLCPGSKISGGKILSSRTPHVVNRVAVLLRLAALAIGRTDTCLGVFYRRIKARHGAPKAMTATARKLAVLIYHLQTTGEQYCEPDPKQYDERVRKNKLIRLARQAKELGFDLVPLEQAA